MLFEGIAGLVLLVLVGLVLLFRWRRSFIEHRVRLRQLEVRVHVNGIRGKTAVTRLAAGVFREAGLVTLAKTTGSAARVIDPQGGEEPIPRLGAATINEQVDFLREHITPRVQALVVECMAVDPLYQRYSQDFMIDSDVTIITNVREDHQEVMGETLEEIADSLSETIPVGGVLITAEDRPDLRARLQRNAERRGCRFIYADPAQVRPEEMRGFEHLEFEENVACCLELARLLQVERGTAVRGMWRAVPDEGAVRVGRHRIRDKEVLWAPLFAANDRESVKSNIEVLRGRHAEYETVVAILNNRWDRGRRAESFAELVADDLRDVLDHVVTFGAYEPQVTDRMVRRGYPRDRITNLGDTVCPSLEEILERIADVIPGERAMLLGLANIRTPQAEMLMTHFAREAAAEPPDGAPPTEPDRVPRSIERVRRAATRDVPDA